MEITFKDKYGSKVGYLNNLNDFMDKYGNRVGRINGKDIMDKYGSKIGAVDDFPWHIFG